MAFCNRCGAQSPDGAVRCSGCGAPLKQIQYPNHQNTAAGGSAYPPYQEMDYGRTGWDSAVPRPEKNSNAVLWGIIGLLTVLLLLFVGFLFRGQIHDLLFGGVHSIEIEQDARLQEMEIGDVRDLTVYLAKEGVDDADLRWESDNPYTASVSDGIVQATNAGTCTITVWDESHQEAEAVFTIYVSAPTELPEPSATSDAAEATPTPTVSPEVKQTTEKSERSVKQYSFLDTSLPSVSASNVYPNQYLKESDLVGLDGNELQYLINVIYAKNGYIFEKQGTENYFPLFSWYVPYSSTMDDVDAIMGDMDAYNIDLLAKRRDDGKDEDVRYNSLNSMWTYRKVCAPLSADFLSGLSKYDLALLGNTILAKNGYIFSNNTLKQIFSYQVWYKGQVSNMSSLQMSSTDWNNLEMIQKYISA